MLFILGWCWFFGTATGLDVVVLRHHYKNTPMQYTAIFHGCKNENIFDKKLINFLLFAQDIEAVDFDCGRWVNMVLRGYKSHGHVILMVLRHV